MLRISFIWPDLNSYVRLGVFHTIFSAKSRYKEVAFLFFPQNFSLKFLIVKILDICRVL